VSEDVLDACFSGYRVSAIRLETLPAYTVRGEAGFIQAWRDRKPRPERSVRNDEYLREVAADVLAGRERHRIRVVDEPLSEYIRWELAGLAENAVAGEETRIAVRAGGSEKAARDLAGISDFWFFDQGTEDERAVLLYYDGNGEFESAYLATAVDHAWCRRMLARALRHAVPLSEFTAKRRHGSAAA
jgi:Family of unknown function (DUF6879)